MGIIQKYGEWILAILIVVILGGSLPFKFSGDPMPTHIFNVVGEFMGLGFMQSHGAIIIGIVELVCCIFVLVPSTRALGGLLTAGTMAGAIFFHLFSPLGVTVTYMRDGVEMSDGTLFYTAILAFIAGLILAYKNKDRLPIIGSQS